MTDPSQQVADLIAAGRKIEAIKLLREHTGIGLAEAKAAVERLEAGLPPPAPAAPAAGGAPAGGDTTLPADVQALVDQGKLLDAIKRLRQHTGMGLKEAKDHIDRATGKVHRVGCGAALLLLLPFAVAFWLRH